MPFQIGSLMSYLTSNDQRRVKEQLLRITAAIQKRDTTAIAQAYALDDPRFSTFEDIPPFTRVYRKGFEQFLAELQQLTDIRVRKYDIEVNLFSDVAVATGYERWTVTQDGRRTAGSTRFTSVLIKKKEQWFVIHEHFTRLPEKG